MAFVPSLQLRRQATQEVIRALGAIDEYGTGHGVQS